MTIKFKKQAREIAKNIYKRTKFIIVMLVPYVISCTYIRLYHNKKQRATGLEFSTLHRATWNTFIRNRDVSIPTRCLLLGVSDPTWIYWKQNCDGDMMCHYGPAQSGISLFKPEDWKYFCASFFSSILKRIGYLPEAKKLNEAFLNDPDERLKAYAHREIADILHLYYMWKCQTTPDFEKGVFMVLGREFETPNTAYEAHFNDINEQDIIRHYQKAASFGQSLDIARHDLARFYRNTGRYSQALETYETIVNPHLCEVIEIYKQRCRAMITEDQAPKHLNLKNIGILKPVHIGDLSRHGNTVKKVWAETQIKIDYRAAYRKTVKQITKTVQFPAKHIGTFKSLRRLSHTLTCVEDKYLLKDSNHLPEGYFNIFAPRLLEYTCEKALIRPCSSADRKKIDTPVISLGGTNQINYYHNLFEMLGGLATIADENYYPDRKLLFWNEIAPFQREIINLLGVKNEILTIQGSTPPISYEFTNALQLPSAAHEGLPHPSGIRFLRERLALEPKEIKKGKKVHIIRKSRRVIGSEKRRIFTDYLEKNGFELVDTATMSLHEQIEYFGDVEIFSADTGAACSNLLFCPQNTKAIIVAPSIHVHEIWSTITACLKQKLWLCLSDPLMHYPNPYFIWNNMVLDIDIQNYHTCLQQAQDG